MVDAATSDGVARQALEAQSGGRAWIGFEGIVASGKTTQSRLLSVAAMSSSAHLVPEFGDHDLGRYLSLFGSPGMRLTPEGCETSYVRHVLALASHVQKLEQLRHRTTRDVVLLDVATLTDAAYALADLPLEVETELRSKMMSAVDSLIALVQPPPGSGVLIYLDCDPKVAAERLEGRVGSVGQEHVEFLVRMHEAYEYLLHDRKDVMRVDANRSIEQVAESVRSHVGHLIR
jgi:thymidylate kinase